MGHTPEEVYQHQVTVQDYIPQTLEHVCASEGARCDVCFAPMRYQDFMLDIETLGNRGDAAVVQIGVVGFDRVTGAVAPASRLYVRPHPKSTMDYSTVKWWMEQSDEARKAVFTNEDRVMEAESALYTLNSMFERHGTEGFRVWGKPATFDITILESLYRACYMEPPWKHWNVRCLRTLLDVTGYPRELEVKPEIKHDGGHDARAQAKTALLALKRITDGVA